MMPQTEEMPDQSSESHVKKETDNEDEHVAMYLPFRTIAEICDSELEPESSRKRLKCTPRRRQTKHMSVGGATQKPRCEVCGKIYSSLGTLRLHMKIHLEEKSHVCEACGRVFRRVHHLVSHKRSVHQVIKRIKQFFCDVCGIGYTEKRSLQNHMAEHNGVKDFRCEICGKIYWHTDGLRRHIHRVHEKAEIAAIRSDPCEECGKTFVDTLTLTRHMKKHTGEQEASCSICKMEFTREKCLNKHMKLMHNPFIIKKKRARTKKWNNVSDLDNYVRTILLSSQQLFDDTTVPEKIIEKSGRKKEFSEPDTVMKAETVYSDSEFIHSQSFDTYINRELSDDLNKTDQTRSPFSSFLMFKKEPADPETDKTSHEVAIYRAHNSFELTAVIKKETDTANVEAGTVTSEPPVDIKLEYSEVKVTVRPDLLPSVQITYECTAVEGEVDDDHLEPM